MGYCNYGANDLTSVYEKIKDFHIKFNHPAPSHITQLTPERKEARATWMREEINEFLCSNSIHMDIDAMVDLLYFVIGTTVEMGIDPSIIFDIVHNANMNKLFPDGKPHYNELGKVIKPDTWCAPDNDIKEYIDNCIKMDASQLSIINEEK